MRNLFLKNLLFIYHVTLIPESFYVQDDDHALWIDSVATIHVCKDRSWFKDYEAVDDRSVLYIGYHNKSPVVGCGCVSLCFSFGKSLILRNVNHVPKIR